MANFEDIAKKAFYMGVGFASYAQEKASDTVKDLGVQAQKLAEEMVERGEMSTEEARKFVDDLMEQAQQGAVSSKNNANEREPRRIEIVDEMESNSTSSAKNEQSTQENANGDDLRRQVQTLQDELRRLKKEM